MSSKDECLDMNICLTGIGCNWGVTGGDYELLKELLELDYKNITDELKTKFMELFKKHTCLTLLKDQTILHILSRYLTEEIQKTINKWSTTFKLPKDIESGMNKLVNFLHEECEKNTPFAKDLKETTTKKFILFKRLENTALDDAIDSLNKAKVKNESIVRYCQMIKIIGYLSEGKNINIPEIPSSCNSNSTPKSAHNHTPPHPPSPTIADSPSPTTADSPTTCIEINTETIETNPKYVLNNVHVNQERINDAMNMFVDMIYDDKTSKRKQSFIEQIKTAEGKKFSSYGPKYEVLDCYPHFKGVYIEEIVKRYNEKVDKAYGYGSFLKTKLKTGGKKQRRTKKKNMRKRKTKSIRKLVKYQYP